jgi:hypothetical protein
MVSWNGIDGVHNERRTDAWCRITEVEEGVDGREAKGKEETDEPDANRHHYKPEEAGSAI